MNITNDIFYVGVQDHDIDLFEGQYLVPNGMAYNSYVILGKKIAVMDTVDRHFTDEWLNNLKAVLGDRTPDYLVVQHVEPDHSAGVAEFLKAYPDATVVASSKALSMLPLFYGSDLLKNTIAAKEGDTLPLGNHTLQFIMAPMVHWPEVMVTYDTKDEVLFSADGFGKFGALDREDDDWACEARRYYFGIVGKYGAQTAALLNKAATLSISTICPLHGPVLKENLGYYLNLYKIWSSYEPESDGVAIFYTSVYGNTKKAVEALQKELTENGCKKVVLTDLARCDMAEAVEDAFRYKKLVLATTTYNADIFPFMKTFIDHLLERNFQNRTLALMENGSWAPVANKVMAKLFQNSKNITLLENTVTLRGALNEESHKQISALAKALAS